MRNTASQDLDPVAVIQSGPVVIVTLHGEHDLTTTDGRTYQALPSRTPRPRKGAATSLPPRVRRR
jgi:hypothetical protein